MISLLIRLLCSPHDYHLVNHFTVPSEYDIVHESGRTPNTWNSQRRIYITDYKCSNCNHIKRLKVKTSK